MREKWFKYFDFVSEYGLYAVIFFMPISNALIEIFTVFVLLAFIGKKILKPEFKVFKSWTHILLLVFLIFGALSIFNSGSLLFKSLRALFFKWLKFIAMFLFVEDTFVDRKRVHKAVAVILFMAGVVAIDCFFQKIFGMEFLRNRPPIHINTNLVAITGAFNHYNSLASYLLIVIFVALSLAVSRKTREPYRVIFGVLGILLTICLIFTFSRGGWLGFVFAFTLMLVLIQEFRRFILPIALLVLFIFLIPQSRERILVNFADAGRFNLWGITFTMIKENPFLGKGIGTYMDCFHKINPNLSAQYAHGSYLQIWAEAGIFSLLSFLSFLSLLLSNGIKLFKKNNDYLLLGVICGVFGLLTHSYFDSQFYSLQLSVLLWFMLGILSCLIRQDSKNINQF